MPFSPVRKLKSEPLLRSERYLSLPPPLRLFLLSLLLYVDQAGREMATARVLQQALYEFDEEISTDSIDEMLLALEERGWLLLYESGRRIYLQINPLAWAEFVTIDRRDGSQHPAPDVGPESAHRAAWAAAGPTTAEGRGEGRESGGARAWTLDPEMPPPQGCSLHPNNTGLIACGRCAGARKIHAAFIEGRISHDEAVAAWTTSTPRPSDDDDPDR